LSLPALHISFALARRSLGLAPAAPPVRILLLYGSLRARSFSRLAVEEAARIHHIVEFKENLRLLLLSALFILLAARVEMADLLNNLNWNILSFLIILIFVARPLGVYLSTIGSQLNIREKLFLCWMAPRGVVAASISSLFAFQLVRNGYSDAGQLAPIVLIIIISTVTIYGLSASWAAHKLGVAKPTPRGFLIIGAHWWAREL